jgi:hypothetical protein
MKIQIAIIQKKKTTIVQTTSPKLHSIADSSSCGRPWPRLVGAVPRRHPAASRLAPPTDITRWG